MAKPCAIYVRQSLDRLGDGLAVERQEEECRALAERQGWSVAAVYRDTASASSGRRPEFARLLADLDAGGVVALVAWHPDRLARRPDDLERLIVAVERHRVKVATVEAGDFDLGTPTGRGVARTVIAWARVEVEHKGQRQRASNAQAARAGLPPRGGRRLFGYSSDGMAIVPLEAQNIRLAADSVLAGASLRSVVADWNTRGLHTTAVEDRVHADRTEAPGPRTHARGAWTPSTLRSLLSNPRFAALRVTADGTVVSGTWPAVLEPAVHYALRAEFSRPERKHPGRSFRHLLSGVAVCGVEGCGLPLIGAWDARRGNRTYRCPTRAHLHRVAPPVEAYVVGAVLGRLSGPQAADLLASDVVNVEDLRAEKDLLRDRGEDFARLFAEGLVTSGELVAASTSLRERREEIDGLLATVTASPILARLVTADDVEAVWDGLSVDVQRAVIRDLMTPRLFPVGQGARSFAEASVVLGWRKPPAAQQEPAASPSAA